MPCNLSLALASLKSTDLELGYNLVSGEALREVEHLDRVGEGDHNPVLKHVQVHNLKIGAELH